MYIQAQQASGDQCLTERRPDDQRIAYGPMSARVGGRKVQKARSLNAISCCAQNSEQTSANKSAKKSVKKTGAQRTQGFTVIELVVAMAIAAVLASIALPEFNGFIVQQRLTAAANGFAGAIAYARSESTRRGSTVSLQSLSTDNDNEWGQGYCVVIGNPGNCSNALRLFDEARLATMNGQGALNAVSTLSFNSRGLFTLGATGQIDLCSDDTLEDPGRQLEISVIGRLNVSELDCPN